MYAGTLCSMIFLSFAWSSSRISYIWCNIGCFLFYLLDCIELWESVYITHILSSLLWISFNATLITVISAVWMEATSSRGSLQVIFVILLQSLPSFQICLCNFNFLFLWSSSMQKCILFNKHVAVIPGGSLPPLSALSYILFSVLSY